MRLNPSSPGGEKIVRRYIFLASALLPLGSAANAVSNEPSEALLSTSLSTFYSSSISEKTEASHSEATGGSIQISYAFLKDWQASLSTSALQVVDSNERDLKLQNSSVSISHSGVDLNEDLTLSPALSVSLPTNEDDKAYLGYRGGLSLDASLGYKLYTGKLGVVSIGGLGSLSKEFYEYDASKNGAYNDSYGYSLGTYLSLSKDDLSMGASYNSSVSWRTDGEARPEYFSHSVYVSYKVTSKLSLRLKEGMSDRVFAYNDVSPNVRFYDRELTSTTVSATYSF